MPYTVPNHDLSLNLHLRICPETCPYHCTEGLPAMGIRLGKRSVRLQYGPSALCHNSCWSGWSSCGGQEKYLAEFLWPVVWAWDESQSLWGSTLEQSHCSPHIYTRWVVPWRGESQMRDAVVVQSEGTVLSSRIVIPWVDSVHSWRLSPKQCKLRQKDISKLASNESHKRPR
jgi:hypothetical protein